MAEGALALGFETLVGPIYIGAWAGRMGIPAEKLPWLTALPLLGAVGQLIGVAALSGLSSRLPLKWLCITLSSLARSLWCLLFLFPSATPEMVGIVGAVSSAIGLTSTSFWMAWMKGCVPRRFEGRFWGVRARGSTLGVLSAHVIAGVTLWHLERTGAEKLLPFAVLLAVAMLSALGSVLILATLPEGKPPARRVKHIELLRSRPHMRLLVITCLFQAGMGMVGPYFPYYFTHEMGLPSAEISLWYGLTQVGMAVSAIFWGRRWDRTFAGRGPKPASMLRFTGILLALSPLPYVVNDPAWLHWIGPPEYFINGVFFAGFQIGISTILFKAVGKQDSGQATVLFSLLAASQGVTSAAAAWLGSKLALWLAPWGGFRALWVVGTAFRLSVAIWVLPRLSRNPH
jgi:hypothetical protein